MFYTQMRLNDPDELTSNFNPIALRSIRHSVASSFLVLVLAAFYVVSRTGLPDKHINDIFLLTGLSLLILNLSPQIVLYFEKKRGVTRPLIGDPQITVFAIIVLVAISYVKFPLWGWVTAIVGVICLVRNAIIARRKKLGSLAEYFVLSVFAFWTAGVCWTGDYLSPLFVESIPMTELNGTSLDSLFHISIAQMLKHYDTVSNGLHGLSYVKYHFLSHFVISRLSALTDTHLVYTYNIGYVLIFPPLLFKFFLVVVDSVKNVLRVPTHSQNSVLLIIIVIGVTSFMPLYLFDNLSVRAAVGFNSLFISESYLLSIILLLALLDTFMQAGSFDKRSKNFLLFLVIPGTIALITLAKVSTGFLTMAALCFLFMRLGLYKSWTAWTSLLVATVISAGIAYLIVDQGAADSSIQWMSFFFVEVQTRFAYFVLLFYFWMFCAAAAFLMVVRWQRKGLLQLELRNAQIFLEVAILLAVIGFVPAATLRILGGSAIYFLEPYRWIAFVLFVSLLPVLITSVKLSTKSITVIQVILVAVLCFNTAVYLSKAFKHNVLCRIFYTNPTVAASFKDLDSRNITKATLFRDAIFSKALIDSFDIKLQEHEQYAALNRLMKLDKQDHKRKAIYIRDYSLLHRSLPCYHYFQAIPALTGFCAYQGLDYWCVGESYFFDKGNVTRTKYDEQAFCHEIRSWGLDAFYSYDLNSGKYETVQCLQVTSTD